MRTRILLLGNYGFGNIGDEAMLTVALKQLREELPHSNIVVVSRSPEETRRTYGVEACHLLMPRVLWEILRAKRIVIGCGSLLNSKFAFFRNRMGAYALLFAALATCLGKRLSFHAIGLEDVGVAARILVPWIINRSSNITVRTADTKQRLESLGVTKTIVVVNDPATDLPSSPTEVVRGILRREGINPDWPLVGVNGRYLGRQPIDNQIMTSLASLIDWLIEDQHSQVVFVPMASGRFKLGERDLRYGEGLLRQIKHINGFHLLQGNYSPMGIKGIISQTRLMIGIRLHSAVFAHSTGTPFISINYSPKNNAFLEMTGNMDVGVEPSEVTFDKLRAMYLRVR